MRLDKLLWFLRFTKTRPLAQALAEQGHIRLNGRRVERSAQGVQVGDVLVLEQGDRVAADALVLEARDLEADESLLTGESVPVRKRAAAAAEAPGFDPGGDDVPQVFSGSILTRGRGLAQSVLPAIHRFDPAAHLPQPEAEAGDGKETRHAQ